METGAVKLRNCNTNRNGELHQKTCEYSAQVPIHFCCIVQSHLDFVPISSTEKKKKKKVWKNMRVSKRLLLTFGCGTVLERCGWSSGCLLRPVLHAAQEVGRIISAGPQSSESCTRFTGPTRRGDFQDKC